MSSIRARRDLAAAPLRMHDGFEAEFPGGDRTASEVMLNLTYAGVVALNRVDELLALFRLVLKSFNVLAVLAGDPEPLTPTVISERTLIAKTSVTSVLDSLERLGLVRRRPHPESRRSTLVVVTSRGRAVCDAALRRLHDQEARWMARMQARQAAAAGPAPGRGERFAQR